MGREIRRVPPNWEHPRYTADNARDRRAIGQYISMYDQDYDSAAREWMDEFQLWLRGEHDGQTKYKTETKYFWDYHGGPPDEGSYRPAFTEEPTWYQVYETVSEGTPVTPPFATTAELVDYLVSVGEMAGTRYNRKYSRAAAEKFVETEWAPSMTVETFSDGRPPKIREGAEALL